MATKKNLKVCTENAEQIEAALAAVNGKAYQHTYIHVAEIVALAASAEKRLADLGVKVKDRAGCEYTSKSGGTVANAYKYSRQGTQVRLVRGVRAWFLVSVHSVQIGSNGGGKDRVYLTATAERSAQETLRAGYDLLQLLPSIDTAKTPEM